MIITGDIKLLGIEDNSKPLRHVRERLQAEDVVYGNLEGPFYDKIDPYEYFSKTRWRHPETRAAGVLKEGNFCAVGLANNVMVGEEPIKDTLKILDSMGIARTGAGLNWADACAPAIIQRNGVRYGFLQRTSIFWPYHHRAVPEGRYRMPPKRYGHGQYADGSNEIEFFGAPGVATIRPHTAYEPSYASIYEAGGPAIIHTWPDEHELEMFISDIKKLRPQVDVLVTSNHWRITTDVDGTATGPLGRDFRVEVAHAAIDAGADLVAAHGSHYAEEIEVYKGKAIFYGLGEFYYGWEPDAVVPERSRVKKVKLVVKAEVRGKAIGRVSCFPIISGGWPLGGGAIDELQFRRPADEPDAMDHLLKLSSKFGTKLEFRDDEILVLG
jgi:poly-gamma-glutamate synthesis protein (capsule biosynthesis protein)